MEIKIKVNLVLSGSVTPVVGQQRCKPELVGDKQISSEHALMPRPTSEKRIPPRKRHTPGINTTSSLC